MKPEFKLASIESQVLALALYDYYGAGGKPEDSIEQFEQWLAKQLKESL